MIQDYTAVEIEEMMSTQPWVGGSLVLVDFYADWCKPCQRMTPVLETLCEEFGEVVFVKVNTDNEFEYTQHNKVRSIPTLIIFDRGTEFARWEGGQDEMEIRSWITDLLVIYNTLKDHEA